MPDTFSPGIRSRIMANVHGTDTGPERVVRSYLHRCGLRFRKHAADLPGRPDVVFTRARVVVFVHGCFWHQHRGCSRGTIPVTRRDYWHAKLRGNAKRDRRTVRALRSAGWAVHVLWECQLRTGARLARLAAAIIERSRLGAKVGGEEART